MGSTSFFGLNPVKIYGKPKFHVQLPSSMYFNIPEFTLNPCIFCPSYRRGEARRGCKFVVLAVTFQISALRKKILYKSCRALKDLRLLLFWFFSIGGREKELGWLEIISDNFQWWTQIILQNLHNSLLRAFLCCSISHCFGK